MARMAIGNASLVQNVEQSVDRVERSVDRVEQYVDRDSVVKSLGVEHFARRNFPSSKPIERELFSQRQKW